MLQSGESIKRSSPVTYEALRSPKSEAPPQDRIISPSSETHIERRPSDRIISPTSESHLERKLSDRIISPTLESRLERKPSDLRRGRSISRKTTEKKQVSMIMHRFRTEYTFFRLGS